MSSNILIILDESEGKNRLSFRVREYIRNRIRLGDEVDYFEVTLLKHQGFGRNNKTNVFS